MLGEWMPSLTSLLSNIFLGEWWWIADIIMFVLVLGLGYLCYLAINWNWVIKALLITLFAIINGVFISPITAIAFSLGINVFAALGITGGIFFFPALIGWLAPDLKDWGTWLIGILIFGVIISFINIFFATKVFTIMVSIIVIVIFLPLIIYDVNRIKHDYEDDEWIAGVIELFLDFVNIFIRVLIIIISVVLDRD
jgi:FtsH-binding integral membrane protein